MSNLLDTLDIMVMVCDMDYKKLDIMGMMERMDTLYTGIHWIPRILGYIICTGYIGYKKIHWILWIHCVQGIQQTHWLN